LLSQTDKKNIANSLFLLLYFAFVAVQHCCHHSNIGVSGNNAGYGQGESLSSSVLGRAQLQGYQHEGPGRGRWSHGDNSGGGNAAAPPTATQMWLRSGVGGISH